MEAIIELWQLWITEFPLLETFVYASGLLVFALIVNQVQFHAQCSAGGKTFRGIDLICLPGKKMSPITQPNQGILRV